ncbi:17036_t:CDS:2 [Funneliformis caledonium]|uniref:17036_t:CDS:1 n=1 Tax=Funneliformis caledonium TaxID=1117310 RepID=A0A9N9HI18_9GLOM|nr:17036_t:CDS:2 [Funneliformis caledonium]
MGNDFMYGDKYAFTLWKNINVFKFDEDKIKYIVWQIEMSEENKPHIQGYVQFNKNFGLNDAKNIFNDNSIHLENPMGSFDDNRNYCSKKYDQCKKHKRKGCKCDYDNLEHRCKKCNEKCERIIARDETKICEIDELLKDLIGPFEAGDPEEHVSEDEKKKKQEILEDDMLHDIKEIESFDDFILKYGVLYKGCKKKILSKNGRVLLMNELNPQFIKWETFLQLTAEDEVPVDVKFDADGANVATMYNIFNSNYEFEKIFNNFEEMVQTKDGRQFINTQHKEALYRKFQYPNGYIIKFEGNYEREGIIRRTFIDDSLSKEELEEWKEKFNNFEFDVRFSDGINLVEVQKYEFNQGKVFEENNHVYYRQNIGYKNNDEMIQYSYNQDVIDNKKLYSLQKEDIPDIVKRTFDKIDNEDHLNKRLKLDNLLDNFFNED